MGEDYRRFGRTVVSSSLKIKVLLLFEMSGKTRPQTASYPGISASQTFGNNNGSEFLE
jgi:hypothetical protein